MAQPVSSPLVLRNAAGTVEKIFNSRGDIEGDYTQASVEIDQVPSMWFVYTVENWDHDNPDEDNTCTIVKPGEGVINTTNIIRSAQGFNMVNPGIVLFEHCGFRGYGNLYQSSIPDITTSFPQGLISGASSIYIPGGVWNLFNGYNYTGGKLAYNGITDLGPGFYDFGHLGANDQAKSLQYVRASN